MSTVVEDRRSAQRRLTEREKREIIAAVAQGEPKSVVAERLNIHRNTVSTLCRDVQGLPSQGKASLEAWRERLDSRSFEAIEASVEDRTEPHKAAATGLSWLKGVGVLSSDNQVNVTVQQVIASVPEDWRSEMILTPQTLSVSDTPIAPPANTVDTTTGCVDLPTNGAPLIK